MNDVERETELDQVTKDELRPSCEICVHRVRQWRLLRFRILRDTKEVCDKPAEWVLHLITGTVGGTVLVCGEHHDSMVGSNFIAPPGSAKWVRL